MKTKERAKMSGGADPRLWWLLPVLRRAEVRSFSHATDTNRSPQLRGLGYKTEGTKLKCL